MASGFGLPPGVDDRATTIAHIVVIPDPGFGIDRLANRTQQAQAGQVVALRMRVGIGLRSLDQGSYGGGRRIENDDLVAFYHFPEAARIRISQYAFDYNPCQARTKRSLCNIG